MTVAQALRALEPREARLLLAAASGFSEASLIAFPERDLPAQVETLFLSYVEKRKAGQPVAYIVGRKEFYGLELAVNPTDDGARLRALLERCLEWLPLEIARVFPTIRPA